MDTLVLHWKTSQWIQSINHFKNIQYQSGLLFRTTVPSMLSEISNSAIVIIYDFNKLINSLSVFILKYNYHASFLWLYCTLYFTLSIH